MACDLHNPTKSINVCNNYSLGFLDDNCLVMVMVMVMDLMVMVTALTGNSTRLTGLHHLFYHKISSPVYSHETQIQMLL